MVQMQRWKDVGSGASVSFHSAYCTSLPNTNHHSQFGVYHSAKTNQKIQDSRDVLKCLRSKAQHCCCSNETQCLRNWNARETEQKRLNCQTHRCRCRGCSASLLSGAFCFEFFKSDLMIWIFMFQRRLKAVKKTKDKRSLCLWGLRLVQIFDADWHSS